MYKTLILTALFLSSVVMASPVPVAPDAAEKKKLLEEPLQSLSQGEKMTPGKMLLILREVAPDVEQNGNQMFFKIAEYPVILIYDNSADRMRLVVPIMTQADLKEDQLMKAMEANFHSVLDVRYAIGNGFVFSVFVHPLSTLDEELFRSAIQQVVVAAATFGEEYASGPFTFPAGNNAKPEEAAEEKPQEETGN